MKLRALPNSGLEVSIVGLGGNNFTGRLDFDGSRKVIHRALDAGVTLFDTADHYPLAGEPGGSEDCIGRVLGARRKDVVLATKFGLSMGQEKKPMDASRRYIMTAVEASLKRLRTDWIDLFQVHRADPLTPIEETLRALDDLIAQGKVRYIGCSNFSAWEVVEAQMTAKHLGLNGFVTYQDEYSLLTRGIEKEHLPAMRAHGLGLLPFFPLASGLLTGKYKRDTEVPPGSRFDKTKFLGDYFMTDANWRIVEGLEKFSARRGHSLLELAFSWLAANPLVASVIAGASTPEQIDQNVAAASWRLGPGELSEIDALTRRDEGPSGPVIPD